MPQATCFQHIDCEGPGTLLEVLKEKRVKLDILKPFQGDPIPEHLGDGLIVLGGPMGVYEENQFPWMTLELDAIRKCLASSRPVLGICLGSQMLAHAAGAQVFRGALPEVGWYPIEMTAQGRLDPLLMGLPGQFEAFHWHGDTFTLPPGAGRLASSHYYPNQVFKIGSNSYGFQCHLEVTGEMVKSWASIYAKELTPQGGPNRPERIEDHLSENARSLRAIGEKVFGRFAALL
jgi:GMP synthase-like glutamine amidotransferase